jgi:hypothetical protein
LDVIEGWRTTAAMKEVCMEFSDILKTSPEVVDYLLECKPAPQSKSCSGGHDFVCGPGFPETSSDSSRPCVPKETGTKKYKRKRRGRGRGRRMRRRRRLERGRKEGRERRHRA